MSVIPYNELHPIEIVVRKPNGESVTVAEINWSYVIQCKHCRKFSLDNSDHDYRSGWWCDRWDTDMVRPDGFCAWGEAKGQSCS